MIFLTKENFNKEVIESEIPVILEFWSEECTPCFLAEPLLNEIETQYKGRVKVTKLNVVGNSQKVVEYGIIKLPTFIILKNGEVKVRIEGFYDKFKLERELRGIL
jgi:thioredoxin 1